MSIIIDIIETLAFPASVAALAYAAVKWLN